MDGLRVVSLESLRRRLQELLGDDSLLFQRFDAAFRRQDEALVAAAMDSLRLYPAPIRAEVEEVILGWLFDAADNSGLADLEPASPLAQ